MTEGCALFAVDSSKLDERPPPGALSARLSLEKFLAIERSFFAEAESGQLRVIGHASPEHARDYNQALSERRASAVLAAVEDAFGDDLRIAPDSRRASGRGEDLALASGLHDPPDAREARREFLRQHRGETLRWPEFRRVDVEVNGSVLVQLRTEG